jgi:hypothetical protein
MSYPEYRERHPVARVVVAIAWFLGVVLSSTVAASVLVGLMWVLFLAVKAVAT